MRLLWLQTLMLGVATGAVACVLGDVDLEGKACPCAADYTCDATTNTCVKPGTTSQSTTGAGGMGQGGFGGGEGGFGGASPTGDAKPLVVQGTIADGLIRFSVDDMFAIEALESHRWMFSHWYDLTLDPGTNLAAESPPAYTDNLIDAFQIEASAGNWLQASDGNLLQGALRDQTPARARLDTEVLYSNGMSTAVIIWVYPNGRLIVTTRLSNPGANPVSVLDSEYNYTTLNPNLSWTPTDVDNANSRLFVLGGGSPSSLQVVNFGNSPIGADGIHNVYWREGARTLANREVLEKRGAVLLAPPGVTAETATSRSTDLRNAELVILGGAEVVGTGFDQTEGAYRLRATAKNLSFGVAGGRARYAPAFVIDEFANTQWRVFHNGKQVAASDQLIGFGMLAHHDLAAQQLVLVSLEESSQDGLQFEIVAD